MNNAQEIVERMKREITSDCWYGLVPPDVKSFGELHDFRDANAYGGFCDDDFDAERDIDGDMTQRQVDFIELCQDIIDDWIRDGGLDKAFQSRRGAWISSATGTIDEIRLNAWYWARKYQALRNKP